MWSMVEDARYIKQHLLIPREAKQEQITNCDINLLRDACNNLHNNLFEV